MSSFNIVTIPIFSSIYLIIDPIKSSTDWEDYNHPSSLKFSSDPEEKTIQLNNLAINLHVLKIFEYLFYVCELKDSQCLVSQSEDKLQFRFKAFDLLLNPSPCSSVIRGVFKEQSRKATILVTWFINSSKMMRAQKALMRQMDQ